MANVKLSNVIRRAQTKVDKDDTDLVFYVGGEHIESENIRVHSRGIIVESTIGPMFYYGFKAGDFLLVSRNPHLKKAGLVDFDGICSEKTFVLETANSDVLLPEFLPFVLQNERFWDYAYRHRHGSTNTFINWSTLANYEFELPDLETQRKLAEVLWSINDTMEAYKNLISATDELVKSQFMEQFGSYLGDETRCATVEQVCTVFADGDWIESKDQADDGIRLIQTGNVGNGVYLDKGERARYIDEETFVRLNCTEVLPNDILISRLPDPVGRACIIPDGLGKSITAVDCSIVRLKSHVLPEFFVAYTMTTLYAAQIGSSVTGSTRKRISRKNLGQVVIPTPDIDQQEQFAAFVRQSDKSKFAIQCCSNLNLSGPQPTRISPATPLPRGGVHNGKISI